MLIFDSQRRDLAVWHRDLGAAGFEVERDYVWGWDLDQSKWAIQFKCRRQELIAMLKLSELEYKER